jgi:hypothetical protein
MWHRRETRRKTEKTNFSLKPEEGTEARAIESDRRAGVSRGHSVRWTALKSGGLKSLWLPDEGGHIQKRG